MRSRSRICRGRVVAPDRPSLDETESVDLTGDDPARDVDGDDARSVASSTGADDEGRSGPLPQRRKKRPGRPPQTGDYVDLADAKTRVKEMEWQAERRQADSDIRLEKAAAEAAALVTPEATDDEEGLTTTPPTVAEIGGLLADLQIQIKRSLQAVEEVAGKSRNLKGTFVKRLRDSAAAISAATDKLKRRTANDEILEAANNKLKAEVADLRHEMAALREKVATQMNAGPGRTPAPAPQPRMEVEDFPPLPTSQPR